MAVYTFKCSRGHTFNVAMKIFDYEEKKKEIVCPECGVSNVERQYKTLSVIYKAKGFYTTGE